MEFLLLASVALVVIVAVAAFSNRIGIATPLILVFVGVALSFVPGAPRIEFEPEFILLGVLPPILYGAAVNTPIVDFRRNLRAITGLGVVLVIISTFASGLVLFWLLPDLSLPGAIALGAVISPPDAVAATSIAKRVGLPPRLVTVLEGESLINDATALVTLRTAIAATAGTVSFWGVLGDFVYAAAVAALLGFVVGWLGVLVRARLADPVLTTAISFAVPFLAYLPAEQVHASGVIAVVVAGLVTGNESAKRFSAQDRISERINWRTVQFVLENGVFLFMGYELWIFVEAADSGFGVWNAVWVGLAATATLVIVRYLFVIPLVASLRLQAKQADEQRDRFDAFTRRVPAGLGRRLRRTRRDRRRLDGATLRIRQRKNDLDFAAAEQFSWRGGAVLGWAGMRGVVTLAAAVGLPNDLPYRPQLILIAFVVAIVTLIGQGATLPAMIRLVRLPRTDKQTTRMRLASLFDELSEAARVRLEDPDLEQPDGRPYDPQVVQRVRDASLLPSSEVWEQYRNRGESGPNQQYRSLRLLVLEAERTALLDARAEGAYDAQTLERAQLLLDQEQAALEQRDGH